MPQVLRSDPGHRLGVIRQGTMTPNCSSCHRETGILRSAVISPLSLRKKETRVAPPGRNGLDGQTLRDLERKTVWNYSQAFRKRIDPEESC